MTTRIAVAHHRRPAVHAGWLSSLISVLALSSSRRRLADLDDHMLRDIGVTRDEARSEAARPVWDARPEWHR